MVATEVVFSEYVNGSVCIYISWHHSLQLQLPHNSSAALLFDRAGIATNIFSGVMHYATPIYMSNVGYVIVVLDVFALLSRCRAANPTTCLPQYILLRCR